MQYVHLTRCVNVKNKSALNTTIIAGGTVLLTILAGAVFLPLAAVVALLGVIAYCRWWLYDRLICLDGEKCAIGLLGNVEPPEKKSGLEAFDTDFSINLVLAPHNIQELPADYLASPPPASSPEDARRKFKEALHRQIADDGIQGHLIKEQKTTADETTIFGTKRFGFEGYFSTAGSYTAAVVHHHQPYLHCEFEGGGVYQVYRAAEAALAFATAATVVCAIPFLGWIACAVLSAIAGVIVLAGVIAALNDKGKPSVVGAPKKNGESELHNGQDILLVRGDWVYDSAHQGWNELHPIKHCQLIGTATYERGLVDWDAAIANYMVGARKWKWDYETDPKNPKLIKTGPATQADWKSWATDWCNRLGDAGSSLTVVNQDKPENKWGIHPVVDGCRPEPSGHPPPPPIH